MGTRGAASKESFAQTHLPRYGCANGDPVPGGSSSGRATAMQPAVHRRCASKDQSRKLTDPEPGVPQTRVRVDCDSKETRNRRYSAWPDRTTSKGGGLHHS